MISAVDSSTVQSARADAQGAYQVSVPAGRYFLRCVDDNANYAEQWWQSAASVRSARQLTVTLAGSSGIDFVMQRGGAISGRVSDGQSQSIPGANVLIWTDEGVLAEAAQTAADGRYAVTGLPAGQYTVEAGVGAESFVASGGSPVVVSLGATASANVSCGCTSFKGVVRASGVALANATVEVLDYDSMPVGQAVSQANGGWSVFGLDPDQEYQIVARTRGGARCFYGGDSSYGGWVQPSAGSPTTGLDISLPALASLGGTVRGGSGRPVGSAGIEVYGVGGALISTTITDADGAFRLGGLEAGAYRIRACLENDESWFGGGSFESATDIPLVTGQSKTGLSLVLPRNAALRGVVTVAGGAPVSGAVVDAGTVDGTSYSAVTGADGSYMISLPEGDYTLRATAPGRSLAASYFSDASGVARVVHTVEAEEFIANITMTPGAAISGTVRGLSGTPLSNVLVSAFDGSGTLVGQTQTGLPGAFRISGLEAGEYRLRFEEPLQQFTTCMYGGVPDWASATTITLATGQLAVVTQTMQLEGSLPSDWQLSASATPRTVGYGRSSLLSGGLRYEGVRFSGENVQLYASTNGAVYGYVGAATPSGSGSTKSVAPRVKTWYRFSASNADGFVLALSPVVVVTPKVYLTVPAVSSSRVRRGRSFTAWGYLKPGHAAGTYPVVIRCYRLEGRKWRLRKSVSARAYNYTSDGKTFTKYKRSFSLPYAGTWRLKAYHSDSAHAATLTSYRTVRAR